MTYDGHVRQPHHVAWLIAAGRLKKVHFNQMRHASERERLVAESTTQLTLPRTFQNLSRLINKGEYDDELLTDLQLREQAQAARRLLDEQERAGRAEMKRALESSTASASTGHQQIPEKVRKTSRGTSFLPAETAADDDPDAPDIDMEEYTPSLDPRDQVQDELHPARLVGDPSYLPLGTAEQGPLFQHRPFLEARRRHELLERPHSVQRQEYLQQQRGTDNEGGALLAQDAFEELAMEDYVFAVTLPAPASEAEWRAIVKDPSKFVAKKVAKGVEVAWQKLNVEQRKAVQEAKEIEINEWLSSKVCQAALGHVPPERLMKMRWVLVFKTTDNENVVKPRRDWWFWASLTLRWDLKVFALRPSLVGDDR